MNQNFKNEQIAVYKLENELADKTHKLLFEMLSAMTKEQKEGLNGFSIDQFDSIFSIDENGYTKEEDVEMENDYHYSLEQLTQVQQKEIIDFILLNNLVD